jgi:hypothetical protein
MRRMGLVVTTGVAFAATTAVMRWYRDDSGARATRTGAASAAEAPATPPRSTTAGEGRAKRPPSMVIPPRTVESDPAARIANHALRNAIDAATLEDMFHREARIEDCLDPALRAGAEKLRFTADVVSSEASVTVGTWRLVEAGDGAALTEDAIECAERAIGGDLVVTAPDGQTFPTYAGTFSFTYRIPAPSPPG